MKRHIILAALALLTTLTASAQAATEIRYVASYGKYENDGRSWKTAKKNIQDAINDLADHNLTGEVWVAEGTYSPTESTESSGGSTLYMSFKVPAGITVRGGFFGLGSGPVVVDGVPQDYTILDDLDEGGNFVREIIVKENGVVKTGATSSVEYLGEQTIDDRMTTIVQQDTLYRYNTTMTGDLSQTAKFQWNSTKNYWDASFYGNCYHVVWFATNGFDASGHANPLAAGKTAMVEGFTIMNGNAKNTDLNSHHHNAYGGGVYMVKGSRLENCRVTNCEASRDGGGIYMDGGGIVEHCYVDKCQALGIGVQNGYGGGICIDTNPTLVAAATSIDDRLGISRSVIVGNVARMGGGMAIKYTGSVGSGAGAAVFPQYLAFASAVLVANNSATTEGGGVYTNGGGALTNMTIVRNKCYGTGIISYGMTTGRAGGLYCRDHAQVLNSVIWGNECQANSNIQYAATRSQSNVRPVDMKFCAVSLADYVDWSSTTNQGTFDISNYNNGTEHTAATGSAPSPRNVFPNFTTPSSQAGYYAAVDDAIFTVTCWVPSSNSGLADRGIVANDLNLDSKRPTPFTTHPLDVIGKSYTSRSTLGAYKHEHSLMTPTDQVDTDGSGTNAPTGANEWHFFVDPNAPTFRTAATHGASWTEPANHLGNVLHTINERTIAAVTNWETAKFFIHIKEGDVDNTNSYLSESVRNVTMYVPSNVTILGGYPSALTERKLSTTTLKRNPITHPTFVRGDIMQDYNLAVSRMFVITDKHRATGVHDVTIDGLQVRNVNSRSNSLNIAKINGGAFIINQGTDITIKNCIVAGCTAVRGAALYTRNSSNVNIENCIFHNNEARDVAADSLSAVIFLEAESNAPTNTITINHSDVMNNVGYAIMLHSGARLQLSNSMLFANTYAPVAKAYYTDPAGSFRTWVVKDVEDNTADIKRTAASTEMEAAAGGAQFLTLDHTLYDEYTTINGVQGTLSYQLNKPNAYPRFVNGVINTGVSAAGDMTFYGRATSFQPHNDNPMTNAAAHTAGNPVTTPDIWGFDMTISTPRTYGGLPDVGAIENHSATNAEEGENAYPGGQKPAGTIVYVRTEEDGGNDSNGGTSWDDAVSSIQRAIEMANEVVSGGGTVTEYITETINVWSRGTALTSAAAVASSEWVVLLSNQAASDYMINNSNTVGWQTQVSTTNVTNFNYLFKFVPKAAGDTRSGSYYIKTYGTNGTDGHYITTGIAQNVSMTVTTNGDANYNNRQLFDISTDSGRFIIRNTTMGGNRNYVGYASANHVYGVRNNVAARFWTIYSANIQENTITTPVVKPIPVQKKQVWVAKGTYTKRSDEASHATHASHPRVHDQKYSVMLREGVNVYGGFNNVGYPCLNDRNPKLYETIIQPGDPLAGITEAQKADFRARGIDGSYPLEYRANSNNCGSFGRVVVQESNFTQETVLDGFTITNGFLNTTGQANVVGRLYKIMSASANRVGLTGGAGVYLMRNGVIENCLIKGNMTYSNPEGASNDPVYAENNGLTYQPWGNDGGFHSVAAGVYNNGGKIVNSTIAYNMILFELMHEGVDYSAEGSLKRSQAAWLYGAGLFQESGTVYNTIIHDNKQKITNFKVRNGYSGYGGYDDPYSEQGRLNNEYWPRAFRTSAIGETRSSHQSCAGAGVFLVSGEFYNNTVTNNTYRLWPQYVRCETMIGIGGVYAFSGATIYNCIITKNEPATLRDAGLEHPWAPGVFLRAGMTIASYFNLPIMCFNPDRNDAYEPMPQNITVRYSAIDYKSAAEAWPSVTLPIPISNQCIRNDLKSSSDSERYFFNASNSYGYAAVNAECNRAEGTSYANGSGTNWYGLRSSNPTYTSLISYEEESLYSITANSPAMNNGTNDIPGVTLPSFDAKYTERIKDCTVDMGAYEFDDSYTITPFTITKADNTVDFSKPAVFYVTPEGRGLASGHNPANAACAAKLQRVLDAAGRYKYQHPNQQVIVKVAQYHNDNSFTYYATRTTDESDSDVRVWSIIVPRGVEVWGGYTDAFTNDNDNGFFLNTVDGSGNVTATQSRRNVTQNQTIFDSHYIDDAQASVPTYHVITFTDKVFDGDQKPYSSNDHDLNSSSTWTEGDDYLTMGEHGHITDRAVVDGIFITGGQANLKVSASGSSTENINRYGGAAIVTDYAHVRNCIVKGNQGIYGGALALMHNALVTGCLIHENEADYGGAIYVFRDSTQLSDNTMMDTRNINYQAESVHEEHRLDYKMPKVYSTTIVNNDAKIQGGGVWFYDNVRFTGVAIWQNRCQDQANISGQYNTSRSDGETFFTTEFFPFNYSAVQSIQPSGINNVALSNVNKQGARFKSITAGRVIAEDGAVDGIGKYADYGFFLPTEYSVLAHSGIPVETYDSLLERGIIASNDFLATSRLVTSGNSFRRFVDIGALAIDKVMRDKQLMLRLFVAARPEDLNTDAALAVQQAAAGKPDNSYEAYYAQEGSSFAYPFQRLQDALDYIYHKRGWKKDGMADGSTDPISSNANNMPFEIWLGAGKYTPSVDLTGNFRNFVGNTFAIPEGVSLIGGFNPSYAADTAGVEQTNAPNLIHFYGAYNTPDFKNPKSDAEAVALWNAKMYTLEANLGPMYKRRADNGADVPAAGLQAYTDIPNDDNTVTYRIHHVSHDIAVAHRALEDVNANSIIEPWEFANQTILSGESSEFGSGEDAVDHIVTIVPNQAYVGALPLTQGANMFDYPDSSDPNYGFVPKEQGQMVMFDGLTFTGGKAHGYTKNTIDDDHKMKYNHGGAILVDGNRYFDYHNKEQDLGEATAQAQGFDEATYKHANRIGSVGYRMIPMVINACQFDNNTAGYGGAISTNTSLDMINSSFVHNRALAGSDVVDYTGVGDNTVNYPGAGGAIYSTYQLTAANTLFANNEADDPAVNTMGQLGSYNILSDIVDAHQHGTTPSQRQLYPGSGGAVFMASHGQFHFLNCNFVRNKALAYPAIFTMNPNYQAQMDDPTLTLKKYNQAMNCVFWGNGLDKRLANSGSEADQQKHFVLNKIVNYGRASRGTDGAGSTLAPFTLGITAGYTPLTMEELNREEDEGGNKGYTEQVWFSAYERNRGKTPINNLDLRDITFHPRKHIKTWIEDEIARQMTEQNNSLAASDPNKKPIGYDFEAAGEAAYQNCNIQLDTLNNTNEGPNFVNPSQQIGYDGFEESADWSPSRLNSLTDNGWGKISQAVVLDNVSNTYTTSFLTYDGAQRPVPTFPLGRTTPDATGFVYSAEAVGTHVIDGAYSTMRYLRTNILYQKMMPIGTQRYMFTTYTDDDGNLVPLYRISYDPNPSHNQTYIDMGVYEYNHTQLQYTTEADAVDVLWVSATEKPDNGLPDGSDWSQPTSDLQRAIETLLSSRNGHRKEIRLMDGTFAPIYTIDNNLSFYINTMYQNGTVILDYELDELGNIIEVSGVKQVQEGLGIKSLTIKGGYSSDLADVRDINAFPAIIKQQQRTDNTSERWNHLFYIKDPTQRYGLQNVSDYNTSNGFGNLKDEHIEEYDVKRISTIPIEFDGVTLINDQALPNTQGAAIYYADLSDSLANAKSRYSPLKFDMTQTEVKSTPINVTTKHEAIKDENGVTTGYNHSYTSIDYPAKLIISKSKIMGSGNISGDGNNQSAVYLGDNHGHAIVFNNVLHSNYGQPINAGCRTLTVNNTFAMNSGFLNLRGDSSMIHNSVLWKNNPIAENTFGKQFMLQGFGDSNNAAAIYDDNTKKLLSHNSYTDGPTQSTDYSTNGTVEEKELKVIGKNFNTALSNDNSDFIQGPNFVKPDGLVLERDFNIMASLRLMNKGLDANYDTLKVVDPNIEVSTLRDFKITRTLYDMAINTTYNEDAASQRRFLGTIDLGAYEYQKGLRRVFYVDPLKTGSDTGESWEKPVGYHGIQAAVDLAALYNSNHPDEQAFVFVKGAGTTNKDFHTGESIILRNGVSIYGGINNTLIKTAHVTPAVNELGEGYDKYTDEDIMNYLDTLYIYNDGFVGPNTFRTAINGISTNEYTVFNTDLTYPTYVENEVTKTRLFPITADIMGFHVTSQKVLTSPVINIDPAFTGAGRPKVALRMITVYGNNISPKATDAMPAMVYAKNALIYGSLFRDNDAGTFSDDSERAVIRLDEGAWAVNISAQGRTESLVGGNWLAKFNGHGVKADNTEGTQAEQYTREKTNRIVHSIVNYDGQDLPKDDNDKSDASDAPLVRLANQTKLTLSGHNYRRNDHNMYFQLTSGSKHINEIPITLPNANTRGCEDFLPANLQFFINYQSNLDLLGNPRLLTLLPQSDPRLTGYKYLLDRGCFETWYVADDYVVTDDETPNKAHYWPGGKHFTPHVGSVVYIAKNKSLVCGVDLQPGFLLMKEGSNLYGNGQNVKVSYLAVEREISQKGSVVSMPFAMDYNNTDGSFITGVTRPYYEDEEGNYRMDMEGSGILHLDNNDGTEMLCYDSEARGDHDYDFSATDGAWTTLTATQRDANEGVLVVPGENVITANTDLYKDADHDGIIDSDSPIKLTYRFTAQGAQWDDTIYEEIAGVAYKNVNLGQHDDSSIDNGMTIRPDGNAAMGNNGTYIPAADFTPQEDMGWNCIGIPYLVSNYQTFNEADAGAGIEKNFYAFDAGEENHYNMQVPHVLWLYYDGEVAPDGSVVDGSGGFYSVPSWENTETIDGGTKTNSWHIPYDGVTNEMTDTPHLWMGEGFFVQTAAVANKETLRFYRPVPQIPAGGGMFAPKKSTTRYYSGGDEIKDDIITNITISVRQRTVRVNGLKGGERIAIYDTAGRLYVSDTAATPLDSNTRTEWTTTLSAPGIYIIAVDGMRQKVAVR